MSSAVLKEFTKTKTTVVFGFEGGPEETSSVEYLDTDAMAREIEKLRIKVAALHDLDTVMVEDFVRLDYDLSPGCRCGSCRSFQFRDLDDQVVHYSEWGIEDLVKTYMPKRVRNAR